MSQSKFKTYAVAKFQQLEASAESAKKAQAALVADKTIATSQKDLLNFALENKQEDLLYFKAVYATCGFNLNDDVFVNEEFWNARLSPVLKPANWQHKDTNIIGTIYAVEAQYLDGTPIDIENSVCPTEDFELVVYGVVYKYTFGELAKEIEKRSTAGKLYVSMETWFSDFAYALLDESSQKMKVVARTEQTKGLDKYLRVLGGSGKYNNQRIGRVLKGMTFGGVGFVDEPANPRSDGEVIASITETEMEDKKILEDVTKKVTELESTVASLNTEKATAAENLLRLEERAKRAEDAQKVADGVVAALTKAIDTAVAGFTTSVPPEIAKIDAAGTADAKYSAMISWIVDSAKASTTASAELTAKVAALTAQIAKFEEEKAAAEKAVRTAARTEEVKTLLGEKASVEDVATLMKSLSELADDVYKTRIEELKIVAAKARPEVQHDGGQGKPDAEGASGEGKAGTIRDNVKISVAAALANAAVEPAIVSGDGGQGVVSPFDGLASLLFKKSKE